MNPIVIHTCEVRHADGSRLRIVAARCNTRPLLADFDVFVIEEHKGKPPGVAGETMIRDFPRGAGVFELFSHILARNGSTEPARDEHGNEVPLPEMTREQWEAAGAEHLAAAQECFARAGRSLTTSPRIIEVGVRSPGRNAT